ncbi:MAG: hypothetical protein LC667_04125 [Thioalkalivibrio sp.]|nr:hypothetical protein [Thioalkalivibrio sp.]
MSPWLWALVDIGGRMVSAYLVTFVVVGIFWRILGSRDRFPHITILVIAAILTVPKVAQEFAAVAQQMPTAELQTEFAVANQAFLDAFDYTATREEVRTRLAPLSLDRWPDGAREVLAAGLFTKAHRYSDIHQSLATGRVVRTPVAAIASNSAEFQQSDATHWTPLLEAAARGEPLYLPDMTITDVSESWFMAVTATRARIIVAQALEETHGLSTQLVDAETQLATAFDWIADYAAAMDNPSASDAFAARSALIFRAVNAIGGEPEAANALLQLLDGPGHTRSYVLFTWANNFVDLKTDEWLARTALGETPPTTIVRLNTFRTTLGLPIVHNDVVAAARTQKVMPDWVGANPDLVGLPMDLVLTDTQAGLRALEAAASRLAPAWTPPTLILD